MSTTARRLPMFPLGNVLFPHAPLPLHVFEERYRQLVDDVVVSGDAPEFGVVLIERGSEVGGGDARFEVGTVARVLDAVLLPDGRSLVRTVGTERIRVAEWLADDPYPWAVAEPFGDRADDEPDGLGALRSQTERSVRRLIAVAAEFGSAVPLDVTFDDDPARASFEMAASIPLGALDAYDVLRLDSASARLERIGTLATERVELLELGIRSASPDPGEEPETGPDR